MKSTLSATPPSSDSSEKHGKNEFVVFFPILKIQSELAHVCRGCVFEIWKNPFWSVHSELHLIDQSYRFGTSVGHELPRLTLGHEALADVCQCSDRTTSACRNGMERWYGDERPHGFPFLLTPMGCCKSKMMPSCQMQASSHWCSPPQAPNTKRLAYGIPSIQLHCYFCNSISTVLKRQTVQKAGPDWKWKAFLWNLHDLQDS